MEAHFCALKHFILLIIFFVRIVFVHFDGVIAFLSPVQRYPRWKVSHGATQRATPAGSSMASQRAGTSTMVSLFYRAKLPARCLHIFTVIVSLTLGLVW
jgi:hypothetical protein